ncbi:hypothetical protein [Sphingomonas endophytica]|uniref:Glycosyltransferase RgtA/B/C/D-like domain-containing protein n=1 Tax=Sphingomonas endophytica TaxID=869719 RepID=A0A147I7F2_9SPHN|nr:hypothetical protein [Sphingomonas endophytica]KTT74767.1 hypothetical protein NS334_05165 [Sphingomonas endophytica]
MTPARPAPQILAAAGLALATLVLFWPGVAEYDTLVQYRQIVTGRFDDWHPPVMARLWQALLPLGGGTAPLLVVQLAGYWLGLGLIAEALARTGRARTGWAVLLVGLLPPLLGWQGVVLKDAQMVGAALAATGVIARYRLRGAPVPLPAAALAGLLFGYALLVRANAVFALAPLIAALCARRRPLIATMAIVVAVLALSGPINHGLLGAARSDVTKTQPLYDLAGIAARTPGRSVAGLPPAAGDRLRAAGCVTPYFWDPLGDVPVCAAVIAPLSARPAAPLYRALALEIARHPLAYLMQRAAHLNMTWRWLVPADLPGADPPSGGEPNDDGFRNPGKLADAWQRLAALTVLTPLGWPIAWLALAIVLLDVTRHQSPSPTRRLAIGLLGSALLLEASFAGISPATDLRYHLWPIVAIALAGVLLARAIRPRAPLIAAALALVCVPAIVARVVLSPAPQDYDALLRWRSPVALLPQ